MARVERLPPPPAVPVRAPPVAVAGEAQARIAGLAGGPSLDARVCAPSGAVRAVVICHPHPLYGGSMHSPVPLSIARCLSDRSGGGSGRLAWARFDFRGVGASEGAHDHGRGEVHDVMALIEEVARRAPGAKVTVCGHSFGSWVGFRAAGHDARVDRVLLLAPSQRFFGYVDAPGLEAPLGALRSTFAGAKTIFVGDQDEFCDVDEARALADELGADLRIFEGFDHHFLKGRRAVAEAALPVIAPEAFVP
ncbi:MAG TPA: alpha/beta fold hydrolase [Polyangiaceae bacterium]|nr:alpha/beta fold hydrolase [Polyangiaceae bacterium]